MKKILVVFLFVVLLIGSGLFFMNSSNNSNVDTEKTTNVEPKTIIREGEKRQSEKDDIAPAELELLQDFEARIDENKVLAEITPRNPEMKIARMLAKATANMSDAQMVELQTLRQGIVIRDAFGELLPPYKEQEICDENAKCQRTIVNTQTEQTVWNVEWLDGFVGTGVGQEVVRGN